MTRKRQGQGVPEAALLTWSRESNRVKAQRGGGWVGCANWVSVGPQMVSHRDAGWPNSSERLKKSLDVKPWEKETGLPGPGETSGSEQPKKRKTTEEPCTQ